jgi:hypothetical protein
MNLNDVFMNAFVEELEKQAAPSLAYLKEEGSGEKRTRKDRKAIKDARKTGMRRRHPLFTRGVVPGAITGYGAVAGGSVGGKKGALIGAGVGAAAAGAHQWLARRAEKRHNARVK